jgi:hypothetical protein
VTMHRADENFFKALLTAWQNKTAHQAHETLKEDDVFVTNATDKFTCLKKLQKFDAQVRAFGEPQQAESASALNA